MARCAKVSRHNDQAKYKVTPMATVSSPQIVVHANINIFLSIISPPSIHLFIHIIEHSQSSADPQSGCPCFYACDCFRTGMDSARSLNPHIRTNGLSHQCNIFRLSAPFGETGGCLHIISTGFLGKLADLYFLLICQEAGFDDDFN